MQKIWTQMIGLFVLFILFVAPLNNIALSDSPTFDLGPVGQICLYGEQHGVKRILEKELSLWGEYYHRHDMRHLFVELSYYTAELLNLWMQADDDIILEEIYADWKGTAAHNLHVKEFYRIIKREFPETVFHGTDVGHQYFSTGQRFLDYLEENKLTDTPYYQLTVEGIEQGKHYYLHHDDAYRENMMVKNFRREFDQLRGENIMGIYGSAHINSDYLDNRNSIPSMISQLRDHYGDIIYAENLTELSRESLKSFDVPLRIDRISIDAKDYVASYFGKQDLVGFKDFSHREFWRLENAYEDFKSKKKTGDVLPYNNYPMSIEVGQIFVIEITNMDGFMTTLYYRSDGSIWNGLLVTDGILVE